MILFKEAATFKKYLARAKESSSVGFVPTMGALHTGHVSLIERSKASCDLTVCSIFINPTQFNDTKDFEKYPVTIENDILLLEQSGCDILFLPSVEEMYPLGTGKKITYDFGNLENILEGKYRPGHFQGVGQIVHKLLDIVSPAVLFIGQKDYQQCMIIKKLISLLGCEIKVEISDTFREETGLAMSSRNLRLNDIQKQQAAAIYRMLLYIKQHCKTTPVPGLESYVTNHLLANGFDKVDYVSIADADTLQPVVQISDHNRTVALIAAYIGGVRLIDNMILNH